MFLFLSSYCSLNITHSNLLNSLYQFCFVEQKKQLCSKPLYSKVCTCHILRILIVKTVVSCMIPCKHFFFLVSNQKSQSERKLQLEFIDNDFKIFNIINVFIILNLQESVAITNIKSQTLKKGICNVSFPSLQVSFKDLVVYVSKQIVYLPH